MNSPIYLDYAATTPVDPRVTEKMVRFLSITFGNPSSQHYYGKEAKFAVEHARQQVADLIDAESSEIVWTSGATESNNLALKGAATLYKSHGKHIITLKSEHKAVLDSCEALEKQGFNVTYLLPKENGLINLEELQNAITQETILISIMHINNETGVIQNIAEIANLSSSLGILFHVDAAQSAGKIPISVKNIPIDLISFAAHKIYGPKGAGALYVRKKPRVKVAAQIHGGGQEYGMRSGTLATHQIVGMGEAFAIAKNEMTKDYEHLLNLRKIFLNKIQQHCSIQINSDLTHTFPGILNISFTNHPADKILAALPNIAASTSSACFSKGTEPSYVLRAMNIAEERAKSSIRFSFGRFTTTKEVDLAADYLIKVL